MCIDDNKGGSLSRPPHSEGRGWDLSARNTTWVTGAIVTPQKYRIRNGTRDAGIIAI